MDAAVGTKAIAKVVIRGRVDEDGAVGADRFGIKIPKLVSGLCDAMERAPGDEGQGDPEEQAEDGNGAERGVRGEVGLEQVGAEEDNGGDRADHADDEGDSHGGAVDPEAVTNLTAVVADGTDAAAEHRVGRLGPAEEVEYGLAGVFQPTLNWSQRFLVDPGVLARARDDYGREFGGAGDVGGRGSFLGHF